MNKKGHALLIGGSGFVGKHLKAFLQPRYEITSTGRNIDLRKKEQINSVIGTVKPTVVVNLAGLTTVKETFLDPENTFNIGFLGTLRLLESLKSNRFTGTLLNISSSEVYGYPKDNQLPLDEESALHPMSPYAVNKLAMEALCYQWSQTESFKILTARPFTHIGPGQSERFGISNFAKQISQIVKECKEPIIKVGNLHTTRDITDVRDVVKAYSLLIDKGENGDVYNVCSGIEVSIKSILSQLVDVSGKNIEIQVEKSLIREKEQARILGSNSKIFRQTGWKPDIDLKKTIFDVYNYWMQA